MYLDSSLQQPGQDKIGQFYVIPACPVCQQGVDVQVRAQTFLERLLAPRGVVVLDEGVGAFARDRVHAMLVAVAREGDYR